jgi:cystathionine beta-lyase
MIYDFNQNLNRRETDSVKWRAYEEDVLPLWVADMDFISPQPVIRALQERVAHGVFGYVADLSEPRLAAVDWLEAHYGWKVQVEDVLFVPGVVTAFNLAAHALSSPGGSVLVQTPVYPPMLAAAHHAGMNRQEMTLTQESDGSYVIDFDAFDDAVTDTTRMFLLCNPHNPTGRVFTRQELERMAQTCLRRGVVICSDEIHCDLVFTEHKHIPIASVDAEIAQHTITLMAPSKTFNIAGLDFSIAVIQNPILRKTFEKARRGLVGSPNLLGRVAARAAYREGGEWLAQLMVYLQSNRDFVLETVRRELPRIRVAKPEGTYLAWFDCRLLGINGSPADFFLKQARVALNDGVHFGNGGVGFVRLNFGCPRATLEEALGRMKKSLLSP